MRASDLTTALVFDRDGEKVGHVFEVLADQSGPQVSEIQGRALRVRELMVGQRASMLRLGYKSREMQGPHGLRLVQKLARGYRVPWDEVASIDDGRIELRCTRSELKRL